MKEERCLKCNLVKAGTEKWWRSKVGLCCGHLPKVSELEEHTDISSADYFMIVDADANATKRITLKTLKQFLRTDKTKKK